MRIIRLACFCRLHRAGRPGSRQRLREFDKRCQNRDADSYEHAELDSQLVFHFLDAVGQVDFHHPGGGLLFGTGQFLLLDLGCLFFDSRFQRLDGNPLCLKFLLQVSFDLSDGDFQCRDFGLQPLDIPFVGELRITAGLSPGDDFGLSHAGAGQALDKFMGVEGGGFCFHEAQADGQGGGLQVSADYADRVAGRPVLSRRHRGRQPL